MPEGVARLSRDFLGSPWIPYYGAPRSYWSIFSVINCRPFIHSKRRRKIHNSEEFCVLCNDCSRLESHCELLLCRSFELHSWFPPPASMPEMPHCGKSMDLVRLKFKYCTITIRAHSWSVVDLDYKPQMLDSKIEKKNLFGKKVVCNTM